MRAFSIFTIVLFIIPFESNQEVDCNGEDPCQCDATLLPNETCTLTCDTDEACSGSNLICSSNSLCSIQCTGNGACKQVTVSSNDATDVNILCEGNKMQEECLDAEFECGTGSCSLHCVIDGGKNGGPSCDGVTVTNLQEATSFTCTGAPLTACPTTVREEEFTASPTSQPSSTPTQNPTLAPTKNPTQNPTLAPTKNPTQNPTTPTEPIPTTAPILTSSSMPTVAPTENPSFAPNIQSQEVVDDETATTTVGTADNSSKEEAGELSTNMIYIIIMCCFMCCCVGGFILFFHRRQKKKQELVEAFSTTFGSKSKSRDKSYNSPPPPVHHTHDQLPSGEMSPSTKNASPASPPERTTTQMEEYRKGTDTVTLEKVDQGTFGTASYHEEPFANTFTNKGVLAEDPQASYEREVKFADEIKNTTAAEDMLMDDIVSDMMTPMGPEPVIAEENDDVFQMEDVSLGDDDSDNDVIQEMVTPQVPQSNDESDDDVVIGMVGPTPH